MKKKIVKPLYQQIAIQLAEKIAKGDYQEGEKVNARSTIAQEYQVSPETARKAVQVLDDIGIMLTRHGSGTYVASQAKAVEFIQQYKDIQSLESMEAQLTDSIKRQEKEFERFSDLFQDFILKMKQSEAMNPFVPYELYLDEDANHLGESLEDLNLWQVTGCTIVAIQNKHEMVISPGPYAKVEAGDTLYFVGNEFALQRMRNVFYKEST